jgi:light-regulated signal transduction histidine kinase (bacteriophytochrome)
VTHDALPEIVADSTQIGQLFQNLVSNAVKFCLKETPRVHVSAVRKGKEHVFSVRDNGIGFPANIDFTNQLNCLFIKLMPQITQMAQRDIIHLDQVNSILSSLFTSLAVVKSGNASDKDARYLVLTRPFNNPRTTINA